MKVYLAARFSRLDELLGCKEQLEAFGFTVTSRWLSENHKMPDREVSEGEQFSLRQRFAVEDLEDIRNANLVISFTEPPRTESKSRGGRHVEFGIAHTMGKLLAVVGHRENVFHYLPGVKFYSTWKECLSWLTGRA